MWRLAGRAASRAVVGARPRTSALRNLSTPSDAMAKKLRAALDAPHVEMEDVSGGCGAMYKCYIESPKFEGLNTVKQHKLVQSILKDEIAEMHGFIVKTAKPGAPRPAAE
mmetsp:Transcript_1919/g.5793  ORF Transcript_1919/g.5793 Transcript_1919/m.5793 type:complete len:110 (-) Transcript_1919:26-355(-)